MTICCQEFISKLTNIQSLIISKSLFSKKNRNEKHIFVTCQIYTDVIKMSVTSLMKKKPEATIIINIYPTHSVYNFKSI